MNVERIINRAVLHKGAPISDVLGRIWINEALDKLSTMYPKTACEVHSTYIEVSKETDVIPTPENTKAIFKATNINGNIYKNYSIDVEGMQFDMPGEYKITYGKKPSDVSVNTETPKIHEGYHYAIACFVASRELFELDPNHPRGQALEQEFYMEAEKTNNTLSFLKTHKRRTPARTWR